MLLLDDLACQQLKLEYIDEVRIEARNCLHNRATILILEETETK